MAEQQTKTLANLSAVYCRYCKVKYEQSFVYFYSWKVAFCPTRHNMQSLHRRCPQKLWSRFFISNRHW